MPWKPSCRVLHWLLALDFIRGYGWAFLLCSILAHVVLLAVLPRPWRLIAGPAPQVILLNLQAPSAPPEPLLPSLEPPPQLRQPLPEPRRKTLVREAPGPLQRLAAGRAPQPPPDAQQAQAGTLAGQSSGTPGPVIATPGGGGPAANGTPWGIGSGQSGTAGTGTGAPGLLQSPEIRPPAAEPPPKPESLPPAVDVKALLLAYASGVKSAIVQHKAYPSVAERLGHEGSAKVGFTLSQDGSLDSVAVRESSGFDELDQAAVATVRAAAPFDPLPGESGRDTLTLTITLKFSLGS